MSLTQNLCRVCLDIEKRKKFDQLSLEISAKIADLSSIQVFKANDTVALICQKCIKDVNFANSIRLKCIEAERYFENLLIESKEPAKQVEVQTFREELEAVEINFDDNYEKAAVVEVIKKSVAAKKTKEKFFCSQCFKSFADHSYLKKHEYFRHSDIPNENLFFCDLCGHHSKTKQLIRNHLRSVHSSKPREKFICRICGKLLSSKGNLDGHEKTHQEIDPSEYIKCTVCQKPFKEKRFMIEHRKLVHEKSKAVQCPECSHISTCKGAFNKHFKSVHLKLRDFVCNECGLAYSTNSQLTRHVRIHTGERPYECKTCQKTFRLSSHRKRHEEICPKR